MVRTYRTRSGACAVNVKRAWVIIVPLFVEGKAGVFSGFLVFRLKIKREKAKRKNGHRALV